MTRNHNANESIGDTLGENSIGANYKYSGPDALQDEGQAVA